MPGYSSPEYTAISELLCSMPTTLTTRRMSAELLWWQCQWVYGCCCCLPFEFARFIAYSHTKNTQLHINLKRDYSIFHYTVIISLSLSPSNDTLCIDDTILACARERYSPVRMTACHIFIIRKFMNVFFLLLDFGNSMKSSAEHSSRGIK